MSGTIILSERKAEADELAAIITKCKDRMKTHVVFYKPYGYSSEWVKSDSHP